MSLVLIKADKNYETQIVDMMDEWTMTGEKIVPYAIRKVDYHDFEQYLSSLDETEPGEGIIPGSTYFCLDTKRDRIVGAVNIRHYLNEQLLLDGGHIGDGIRPSERRKGYATKMIELALEKCRELNIHNVLMVCDKDNIGSAKSIQNNGGVLENEVMVDGTIVQRYWINLDEQAQI
ncbi:MAG: GNAT family N-acetyltransferase [Solobacterium sp.]|nr:GNAT family N-acetyltransferase [Solobacterium sp.]